MTLGDKISKLRKENNYTQEQLADILGVSRQAISKWESDLTYPETEKLIRISELFCCSLDYLIKDKEDKEETETGIRKYLHERKSKKTVWGMPLWHVAKNARGFLAVGLNAKGVIAVGLKAQGILSLGLLSIGVLSWGLLSIGLIAVGLIALGVIAAACVSIGVFAFGAVGFGILSFGAFAVGDFSVGAFAIGKYFAIGDHAQGMIAIGDTKAAGSVYEQLGSLTTENRAAVKEALDTVVPTYLAWAKELIKAFL